MSTFRSLIVIGLGLASADLTADTSRQTEPRAANSDYISAVPLVRAQLTPRRFATLSAEIAARVVQLHVREGGAFAAGDPLVSFDDALPRAQVARAEAVLAATERSVVANRRLRELNSIGQIELELAEAEVKKASADLAAARVMLARCYIAAPYAGRVSAQRVQPEECVQMGQALLEIIDATPPQLDFIAPSKWLAWIKPGQNLEVAIDETGRRYSVVVETIGARVDPVSQSFKVVAGFTAPAPDLVAGMSGTIQTTPPL
jgi:RND family efflux transporter MFP subunit